jgi:hypothetical protein
MQRNRKAGVDYAKHAGKITQLNYKKNRKMSEHYQQFT